MTIRRTPPGVRDYESVLAIERIVAPQPAEVRHRAFARAREAMMIHGDAIAPRRAAARLGGFRWLIAAAVVLGMVSLAAAAYEIRRTLVARTSRASLAVTAAPVSDRQPAAPEAAIAPGAAGTPADPDPAPMIAPAPRVMTAAESYARELRILEPASRAVARGEFVTALAAVADHERRFPNGRLAEEREALRIRSLFGQHRGDEARLAADSFRKAFPKSVLLSGIGEKMP